MTDKDNEELAKITARATEIQARLNTAYSAEELRRPLSTRVVHSLIASSIASVAVKLASLSSRIALLEEGGIRYAGIYQRAVAYSKGDAVTHAGSLWIALKTVPVGAAPSSDPVYWQLAAKGGKPVKCTPQGSRSV
ncbi:transposase [Sinorhizobium alkalisoli]|uniref:transposase n=1 Tax=Sinorhizobium alkalisoli TaxID=1752398 RepID=UPI00124CBC0E|nr:transposase [Sinorhizobium alkalisoli]